MKGWLVASATVLLVMATAMAGTPAPDDSLKVCLDQNRPSLSAHHRDKPDSGFDVVLAHAIADRLS